MNLRFLLPQLLPSAIAWAERQAQYAASVGRTLDAAELAIARTVGVQRPELVRVHTVDQLPLPEDPVLQQAALQTGLLGPNMVGLTLGYSILVRKGYATPRLLSHECRHVYQYEIHGSIAKFLPVYLQEIVDCGYHSAPLEIDARAHEIAFA